MIRKFILLLILATLLMAAIFTGINYNQRQGITDQLALESQLLADQQAQIIRQDIHEVISDLRLLSQQHALLAFIANRPEAKKHLARDLLVFSREKARYDQIRYLDITGMERIRINFNAGNPSVIPDENLQSKTHRYYFANAVDIDPGEIYISPFDLNIEHRQIEVPLKPMIRFAMPVFSEQNQREGVFILNYLGQKILDHYRVSTMAYPGHALLLNRDSYYLAGYSSDMEWGFMFPGKKTLNFRNDHPDVWQAAQAHRQGQLINNQGIFTYAHLQPDRAELRECEACQWLVMLHIPATVIEERLSEQQRDVVGILVIFWLISAVALWLFLNNRQKRIEDEKHIQTLNQAIHNERDLFVKGPTVVVKRRDAFGWPIEYVSDNIHSELGYSPDQFTSHELTFASIVAPEFIEQVSNQLNRMRKGDTEDADFEPYQIVDAWGNRRWVQDHAIVLKNDRGETFFYGYLNDITLLKAAEKALGQARDGLQTVVDTIGDPTLVIDAESYRLLMANEAARRTYLKPGYEGPLTTCYELSHKSPKPCEGKDDPCPIQEIRKTGQPTNVVHRHFDGDGNELYFEVSATPIKDKDGNLLQIIESHRDITARLRKERRLQTLATTDHLTKTHNRRSFDELLDKVLSEHHHNDTTIGLIMFDIDHFKRINDSYGHDIGDQVLQELVAATLETTRREDVLARWGGEEFMLLVSEITAQGLIIMAEQLRTRIEKRQFVTVGHITISCGLTLFAENDTKEQLLKRVDQALYQSKERGRNLITFFESE
ncbi:MAG: diguanylate cyclase [Sedimenticola sp.]